MSDWKWHCIICGKELEILHAGDDSRATWPNIAGGTIEIHFGYGSRYDEIAPPGVYQTCICDDCAEEQWHRIRQVRETAMRRWEELPQLYKPAWRSVDENTSAHGADKPFAAIEKG